jgi:hypothetical protein
MAGSERIITLEQAIATSAERKARLTEYARNCEVAYGEISRSNNQMDARVAIDVQHPENSETLLLLRQIFSQTAFLIGKNSIFSISVDNGGFPEDIEERDFEDRYSAIMDRTPAPTAAIKVEDLQSAIDLSLLRAMPEDAPIDPSLLGNITV